MRISLRGIDCFIEEEGEKIRLIDSSGFFSSATIVNRVIKRESTWRV